MKNKINVIAIAGLMLVSVFACSKDKEQECGCEISIQSPAGFEFENIRDSSNCSDYKNKHDQDIKQFYWNTRGEVVENVYKRIFC